MFDLRGSGIDALAQAVAAEDVLAWTLNNPVPTLGFLELLGEQWYLVCSSFDHLSDIERDDLFESVAYFILDLFG